MPGRSPPKPKRTGDVFKGLAKSGGDLEESEEDNDNSSKYDKSKAERL